VKLNRLLVRPARSPTSIELGDARVFDGGARTALIWRFEKGNEAGACTTAGAWCLSGGQLMFTRGIYSVPLASVFAVKVGAVSGADDIFSQRGTWQCRLRLLEDGADRRHAAHDLTSTARARSPGCSSRKRLLARGDALRRKQLVEVGPPPFRLRQDAQCASLLPHPCRNYDGADPGAVPAPPRGRPGSA
jgi:adenine-specific DNA-methyltransferase